MTPDHEQGQQHLLEVRGLSTGYRDIVVVREVSLHVDAGRITAILGRNGAGKTTLLRAIAGLNRLYAGQVTLQGINLVRQRTYQRTRSGLAFVQENKRIFRKRTVQENLEIGGNQSRRQVLADSLADVYQLFPILEQRRDMVAGQLSGGQQQMLAIGQALMTRPNLLMLDEPSAGLAPSIVSEVFRAIEQLKETGLGVLLVEQAVDLALNIADEVVVLDVGRVVESGEVAQFADLNLVRQAYFGSGS